MPYKDVAKAREYQRKWIAKRRSSFLSDKVCKKCGTKEQLEIHHKDPSTKVTHRFWSWSKQRFLEEIKKCEILCIVCHMEETKIQLTIPLVHGTVQGYNKLCRCADCKEAERKRKREYRATIKLKALI